MKSIKQFLDEQTMKELSEIASNKNKAKEEVKSLTKEDFKQIHDALADVYYEARKNVDKILEVYKHLEDNAKAYWFYKKIEFSSLQRALSIKDKGQKKGGGLN